MVRGCTGLPPTTHSLSRPSLLCYRLSAPRGPQGPWGGNGETMEGLRSPKAGEAVGLGAGRGGRLSTHPCRGAHGCLSRDNGTAPYSHSGKGIPAGEVPAGPRQHPPQVLFPAHNVSVPVSRACEHLTPQKASSEERSPAVWPRRTGRHGRSLARGHGRLPLLPSLPKRRAARVREPLCSPGCRSEFTIFDRSCTRIMIPAPECFHDGTLRSRQ